MLRAELPVHRNKTLNRRLVIGELLSSDLRAVAVLRFAPVRHVRDIAETTAQAVEQLRTERRPGWCEFVAYPGEVNDNDVNTRLDTRREAVIWLSLSTMSRTTAPAVEPRAATLDRDAA